MFQVVAARYERGSIVITTNRAFCDWGKIFDVDNTLATAIIDRLMHHGEAIVIDGKSYRTGDDDACGYSPVGGAASFWTSNRGRKTMPTGRVVIIPFLQGKVDVAGTLVEPDIDAIFEQWLERHPEFQGAEEKFHVIRGRTRIFNDDEDTIDTVLVRVTADFSEEFAAYDPTEDVDLYEEFLAEDTDLPPRVFRKMWIEQCEAAEQIEAEYGTEKALGYLIGEKLLNFLEVTETRPEWRAEIPHFIAEIKNIFEPWQIARFFETPRRLGVLGHTADEEGHKLLRNQLDESEKLRQDTRNLMLFEWAKELLLEGDDG